MMTKITGETPFQVLTSNFSISPSNEGYTLQISADGKQFSNLFSVGAGVTRLVTDVAANSWYRLLGNESAVVINWQRMCVTDGGGSGGSGTTYTAGDYIDLTGDVISVTGITPDLYATSADVQSAYTILDAHITDVEQVTASALTELHEGLMEVSGRTVDLSGYYTSAQTESAITLAVSGKADAKILVDFDKTSQAERASLYADLKALYDGGSGATINKDYDFFKTVGTKQGLKIDYYTFSGGTAVFGKVVSPDNTSDQVVYEQVLTIDSGGNVNVVTNTVGGGITSADVKTQIEAYNYVTSAQVETQITGKGYITNQALTAYTPTTGFATVNGSAITAGGNIEIQGGGGITSADVKTQIEAYNYMDSTDAQVISTALNDLNTNKVAGSGITSILKIEQTDYDTLVAQSATTPTTLYVVVPDSGV